MNCKNHLGIEADYACGSCGQPICLECTVELNNRTYCKECLQRLVNIRTVESRQQKLYPRKSKFLTFLFGWIPGAGHMYLGLINKGLSLMGVYFIGLFSIIFVSEALRMGWLNSLIAPLSIISVAYSIFDSLQICNEINSGKVVNDAEALSFHAEVNLVKGKLFRNKNTIGYVLVILGCIALFNSIAEAFKNFFQEVFHFWLPFSFSSLLVPVLLIIGGIYLIRKSKDFKL